MAIVWVLTLCVHTGLGEEEGVTQLSRPLGGCCRGKQSLNSLLLSTKNSSAAMEVVAGAAGLAPGQGRRGCPVWTTCTGVAGSHRPPTPCWWPRCLHPHSQGSSGGSPPARFHRGSKCGEGANAMHATAGEMGNLQLEGLLGAEWVDPDPL